MPEESTPADWDPRSPEVLADQISAYDAMRAQCPVARDEKGHWSVFGHADVRKILHNPETFSNQVSAHVAVPNGMDPPEHTAYRAVVDQYYTPERMAAFEPVFRAVVIDLLEHMPRDTDVEVMSAFAEPVAASAQSAFMGWPRSLNEDLVAWVKSNYAAVLSQDRERISAAARTFDGHIREQLAVRRSAVLDDVTAELMRDEVNGRLLSDEEIVAIIRNWTVGELGTMSASIGILVNFLAEHPQIHDDLRRDPSLAEHASDEILRIHPPLIANRRRTTEDVTVGDRQLGADERVSVVWASANRDETVFDEPDEFRWGRDPEDSLLYGAGLHVCPGAPLARLEFRVVLEELVARTASLRPAVDHQNVLAIFPASGFAEAWVQIA